MAPLQFQTKLAWTATIMTLILPLMPLLKQDEFTLEVVDYFYLSIRILWPFAICWIIYACHNGFGGIVNKILSAKILIPFSNLSLGIYLANVPMANVLPLILQFLTPLESTLMNTVSNWSL